MHKNGTLSNQNKKKLIIVLVSMPWDAGIVFFMVRKDGQMAPIITRTVFAPFMFCTANQKMARMARLIMAM
jgi:hypothetical protein